MYGNKVSCSVKKLASGSIAPWFRHGSSCLMYHRIVDDHAYAEEFDPNRGLSVRRSEFEAQMRLIATRCEAVSLPDAVQRLQVGRLSSRMVTVTFDDGYEDNLSLALPILRRYGIPATIYVTTAGPDNQPFLWWYELKSLLGRLPAGSVEFDGTRMAWSSEEERQRCFLKLNAYMKTSRPEVQQTLLDQLTHQITSTPQEAAPRLLNWDQVRELDADPLITIGCHTTRHHPMTSLSAKELEHDLLESKQRLEQELQHSVAHFAYPYGQRVAASLREFTAVRAAGFVSAVTTRNGHWMRAHRNHLHALPRVAVTWFDTLAEFKLKLFGVRATLANRGWRLMTD
jgi:peptidoglycan/xylan/chitin deacetylase (PgdA/CDA1 family)